MRLDPRVVRLVGEPVGWGGRVEAFAPTNHGVDRMVSPVVFALPSDA